LQLAVEFFISASSGFGTLKSDKSAAQNGGRVNSLAPRLAIVIIARQHPGEVVGCETRYDTQGLKLL
jgi:hypothetical protein